MFERRGRLRRPEKHRVRRAGGVTKKFGDARRLESGGVRSIAPMNVQHIQAHVAKGARLVLDDRDRVTLIRDVHDAFGPKLLGYCIMDTHYHLVAECSDAEARELTAQFTRRYTRAFNKRHERTQRLVDGPIDVRLKNTGILVAKAIYYDHENPVKARMAECDVVYEWSSARAFAGLTRLPYPNVARARALIREFERWAVPPPLSLANLERVGTPRFSPGKILAAIAGTFGCLVEELVSDDRAPPLPAARSAFVALGRLEAYSDRELAPWLNRSRVRMTTLVRDGVDFEAVRIARTVLVDPYLRTRLPAVALPRVAGEKVENARS
jgi:hypothetical protein